MARLRVLQQALRHHNTFRVCSSLVNHPAPQVPFCQRTLSTSAISLKYTKPEIPAEDEPFIIKSPYSDVEVPEVNLADYVWKDVDKWPERSALVSV